MASNFRQRNTAWALLAHLLLGAAVAVAVLQDDRPAFARGGGGGGGGSDGGGGSSNGDGNSDGKGGSGGRGAGNSQSGGSTAGRSGPTSGANAGPSAAGQRGKSSNAAAPAQPGTQDTGGRGPDDSSEFVGLFASQRAVELAGQLGLEVEQRALPTLGLVISRFRANSPDEADAAQSRLRAIERAGSAVFAPNSVYRPMATGCGDGGCGVAGLRHAVRLSSGCQQQRTIGIVDTEVERSHPALRSSTISVARFLPAATATPAADGHGTAIAALLVGDPDSRFPGIAPRARLYAANAFSLGPEDDVRANAFNLAESLEWLVRAKPSVINLSLAGPPNLLLQTALVRTADLGIVVVAAAGNGGPAAPPAYPAAYEPVIAVTAVDDEQRPYIWANQGDYVQFAAPGVELWTAGASGSGLQRSGTSLAAALFAGLIASAAPPRATRADGVEAWARSHAVDLGARGRDPVYGWGVMRLDAPCGE